MSEESTTPDLVELVNRWGEAANRRDFDAAESFYAPDAVLRGAELVGTFEGAAAIRGLFDEMASAYESFTARPRRSLISATESLLARSS
jgi:ketosteroid isomerase-like protein